MLERLRIPSRLLAAATVGALALFASAAQAQTDLGENAALRYWRAFAVIDENSGDAINEARRATQPRFSVDAELAKTLASSEFVVKPLMRGAAMEHCDFGVDYDAGPNALLPHLSGMRFGASLLLVDARLKADAGDTQEAVDRVVAAVRMCDHMTNDRLLISSLVAYSMFRPVSDVAMWLDTHVSLSNAQRAELAGAIGRIDTADPFRIREALVTERNMMSSWAMARIAEGKGREMFEGLTDVERGEADVSWANADDASLQSYITLYVAAYDQVLNAWDEPVPGERFTAIERTIADGAFGPAARMLLPSLANVRRQADQAREALESARVRFGR